MNSIFYSISTEGLFVFRQTDTNQLKRIFNSNLKTTQCYKSNVFQEGLNLFFTNLQPSTINEIEELDQDDFRRNQVFYTLEMKSGKKIMLGSYQKIYTNKGSKFISDIFRVMPSELANDMVIPVIHTQQEFDDLENKEDPYMIQKDLDLRIMSVDIEGESRFGLMKEETIKSCKRESMKINQLKLLDLKTEKDNDSNVPFYLISYFLIEEMDPK